MQETYLLKKSTTETRSQVLSFTQGIIWFNRVALATVFFWFGFLKIIHISPAEELVTHLHRVTFLRFIPAEQFIVYLGIFECLIGLLWILPKFTRFAFSFFLFHMATTFLPLVFLKSETWQDAFVLTLTGQYIVKNLVLVASAFTVFFASVTIQQGIKGESKA